MIITGKKVVSKAWMVVSVLPWSSQYLEGMAMGAAFFFSLRKFIDDPAGLTFILSLPPFIGLIMGPLTHFLSDRIWTRFGRRKPFIIASWCGTLTAMAMMPLMPTFLSLLGAYMLFILFNTMGGPAETLKQEVVPPQQRVSAAAILTWINQFVLLLFYLVALGRFDDQGYLAGLPVTGEQSIYWSASLSSLIMLLILMLGIKEINMHSSLVGKRLGIRDFFASILNRNLRQIYILIFGAAVYNVGTGAIGSLLYIEQFQFTKQELGTNVAVGGALNLVIIVILGLFANKLPRMKTYQALLVLGMIVNVGFYFYVHELIYDQRPTLIEIIIFGEMLAIIGTLKGMIYAPLVYDYVPRNEMGTYAAGASIINRLVNILMLNGAGLFVVGYSYLFLPQGGEMVRFSLTSVQEQQVVLDKVRSMEWNKPDTPGNYPPEDIHVVPWYGNGAVLDSGLAYEVIFHNADSEDKQEELKELQKESKVLRAKAANDRSLAKIAQREGNNTRAETLEKQAEEYDVQNAPLKERIEELKEILQTRADAMKAQVETNLAASLLQEGQQVLEAKPIEALLVNFPLTGPPSPRAVAQGLDKLRQVYPNLIDLRITKNQDRYALQASVEAAANRTQAQQVQELVEVIETQVAPSLKSVWDQQAKTTTESGDAVEMHFKIVEDPLDQHFSPIMTGVNWILSFFDLEPQPERRVYGFARNLRAPGVARHVRALPSADHSITVTAIIEPQTSAQQDEAKEDQAGSEDDPVYRRLKASLNNVEATQTAFAVYERAVEISEEARLTVAQRQMHQGFSERKYDYMSSYIWMLVLDIIGIIITIVFVRREKLGLIHKRGVEEMEAST